MISEIEEKEKPAFENLQQKMMIDVRGWIWFSVRLFLYSTILFLIFVSLLCAFICWYYWFIIRPRSKNRQEIHRKLTDQSFNFHTLSFHVSNNGLLTLNIQLSELEKRPIEIARLNERKYDIIALDIQDERVEFIFARSNIRLTVQHKLFDQKR